MRVSPNPKLKDILIQKNVGVCCVCKKSGLGVHFHHIDGDNSNTVEENLAVLCVKDHDLHHRPQAYNEPNHLELTEVEIREYKRSWEAFVKEASQKNPKVFAVLNTYGDYDKIHSLRLIFQWDDEKIEFERLFHLLEGPMDLLLDKVLEEIVWVGKEIQLVLVDSPLEIEYCPCCNSSYSNTINSNVTKKLSSTSWKQDSICTIYINPMQPSLEITIFLKDDMIYSGSLHRCKNNTLHFICDNFEESLSILKKTSVRTQVTKLVNKILMDWEPGRIIFGTGDPGKPKIIKDLSLPRCWEKNIKTI
ncbi:HNH endonuclease signature motif containing protein [Paenibacillus sp. 1-18]|uniref:HNH endonuclease signature motif containing protein n=1 Tax=Paenibacillus sp. 1-18 TaxID=1333846 RepID=UPI0004712956|nr:HNH endonuclease signature motif containing protein [Paenibacillus sp. 1-18]